VKHLLLAVSILLTACTSSDAIMTGDARAKTSPESVRVYLRHPERFESIALITATSNKTPSRNANKARALSELKEKAAELGANGLVLTQADGGESVCTVTMVPAGTSAVGVMTPGKGPMVEMQAEAIFVPASH
jgi:hypothetical protein